MNERLIEDVTDALDADTELLPYLAELLADLQELGSSTETVCGLIAPLGLPAKTTRVLDLGCGKGNIGVALATQFGFRALGVDGYAPFIEEAKQSATRGGIAHLCEFRYGDLRDALETKQPYDIVIMTALGRVLGDVRETAKQLRRPVRPGGYIVVDDGYLAEGHIINRENYDGYLPHAETITAMESFGDKVMQEITFSLEELQAENEENTRLIRQRAETLAKKHPRDAAALLGFVKRQELECQILENDMVTATWLIRRGE